MKALQKAKLIKKSMELNMSKKAKDTLIYDNIAEIITELEELQNRSCKNCRYSSYEVKFGALEFNSCFLVSNGNECKWELNSEASRM